MNSGIRALFLVINENDADDEGVFRFSSKTMKVM